MWQSVSPRLRQVWAGLVQAKAQGLARAIGVSSYSIEQLQGLGLTTNLPSVNQCQMSVARHVRSLLSFCSLCTFFTAQTDRCGRPQDDMTRSYCQQHGITYQAWSPLSSVNLGNPPLPAIAAAHGVSTAQVALRWITQQGGCPFAVSPGIRKEGGRYVVNEEYAKEDLALGGFNLTDAELRTLGNCHRINPHAC